MSIRIFTIHFKVFIPPGRLAFNVPVFFYVRNEAQTPIPFM
jgi:hypothetical protein